MAKTFFTKDEYRARWRKVSDEMKRRGYDVAVIWAKGSGAYERYGDVLWMTNYYSAHSGQEVDNELWRARSFSAVVMQIGKTPALHMDEPLEPRDFISTRRVKWHMNPIEGVAEDLKQRKVRGRVALVGSDFFPCKYMAELQKRRPGLEFVPEDDLVASVRQVKSPAELDVFRAAGRTASKAMNAMMKALIAGKTEAEAAGLGAKACVTGGGIPYLLRVAHGKGTELFNFSRNNLTGFDDTAPRKGDLVRGWFMGPMHFGYGYLDPGRTAVCGGKPTRAQRQLIEACASIVNGVIGKIRPGVSAHDLAREGDRLYEAAGGGKVSDQASLQWPLYGHVNDFHFENPMYGLKTAKKTDRLKENMVCSSEAFLTWEGVGAAGFEQNMIIKKDGVEILTTSPLIWH